MSACGHGSARLSHSERKLIDGRISHVENKPNYPESFGCWRALRRSRLRVAAGREHYECGNRFHIQHCGLGARCRRLGDHVSVQPGRRFVLVENSPQLFAPLNGFAAVRCVQHPFSPPHKRERGGVAEIHFVSLRRGSSLETQVALFEIAISDNNAAVRLALASGLVA